MQVTFLSFCPKVILPNLQSAMMHPYMVDLGTSQPTKTIRDQIRYTVERILAIRV